MNDWDRNKAWNDVARTSGRGEGGRGEGGGGYKINRSGNEYRVTIHSY